MGEELERKRISTNPFLYTDGSLVEAEVLHASLDASDGSADGSGASTISAGGGQDEGKDSDQTPQAEVPPTRQVWAVGRAGVVSMDLDDEKVRAMGLFYRKSGGSKSIFVYLKFSCSLSNSK